MIFATQSLADIYGSDIAPAIVESYPTRIFLPNERAFEPQIAATYRSFGLNDRQIEIIARATPKRDYYCRSHRGNRLFALAFTAASSKYDHAARTLEQINNQIAQLQNEAQMLVNQARNLASLPY